MGWKQIALIIRKKIDIILCGLTLVPKLISLIKQESHHWSPPQIVSESDYLETNLSLG